MTGSSTGREGQCQLWELGYTGLEFGPYQEWKCPLSPTYTVVATHRLASTWNCLCTRVQKETMGNVNSLHKVAIPGQSLKTTGLICCRDSMNPAPENPGHPRGGFQWFLGNPRMEKMQGNFKAITHQILPTEVNALRGERNEQFILSSHHPYKNHYTFLWNKA